MIQDPEHEAVLASTASHRVVIAPPGTGKTLLSVRLAGQLARTLQPHARVLLLTFSNQARGQLEREARRRLTPAERQRVEITNYHKFFLRSVFAYRRALGLGTETRLVPPGLRRRALGAVGTDAKPYLGSEIADRLAEWQFDEFKDSTTPAPELLDRLLGAIRVELEAGRLVFDDLGALFWRLMTEHPVVGEAYRRRYPHVIADEHQDASALQDSFVRWLASESLTILCDPMQLIHGFRGADPVRLDRHMKEGTPLSLKTAHRWRDNPGAAEWLLAVRERLEGRNSTVARHAACRISRTEDKLGLNGSISATIVAVREALDAGLGTVAVLVAWNADLAQVRKRLCTAGLRPRQVGSGHDLDEAHLMVERLSAATEPREVAALALTQLLDLVPDFPAVQAKQIERRLGDSVNLKGCSPEVAGYLQRFAAIYADGRDAYFRVLDELLSHAASKGLSLPRTEFCRMIDLASNNPETATAMINGELAAMLITRSTSLETGLFVMTTHQAKGREFDAVVLSHAIERHYTSGTVEGRNLFYVGITRGMRRWYVIAPADSMTGFTTALG